MSFLFASSCPSFRFCGRDPSRVLSPFQSCSPSVLVRSHMGADIMGGLASLQKTGLSLIRSALTPTPPRLHVYSPRSMSDSFVKTRAPQTGRTQPDDKLRFSQAPTFCTSGDEEANLWDSIGAELPEKAVVETPAAATAGVATVSVATPDPTAEAKKSGLVGCCTTALATS